MRSLHLGRWVTAAAAVGPVLAGAALIPLRGDVDNANVALLLVVSVVAAASAGRRPAAVVAALSAAASFNFFHTQPYYSLRIESGDDVETALLLLLVGIAVGEIALRGRRARAVARQERDDLRSIQGLGRLVADGEDVDYVLLATASELMQLLHLVDCQYESTTPDGRPRPIVERDGSVRWGPTVWDSERWGLPTEGATIPVWAHGQRHGQFVLRAPISLPLSREQLAKAAALVDQAGAALAARSSAA